MARKKTKFYVAIAVIIGVMGALIYFTTTSSAVYYMKPSELISKVESDKAIHEDRVRIGGLVVDEELKGDNVGRNWVFHLTDERGDTKNKLVMVGLDKTKKSETVKVKYDGIAPDTFKAGGMAIVEGKYNKDGEFIADQLIAKCPSKYEDVKRPDQIEKDI